MIAVFDLDYTLTKRGTWGRFVWRSVRTRPWLWVPLLWETARDQIAYKRARCPRGAVKQSMMRWGLQHRSRSELTKMAEAFAFSEVCNGLRPGALAALEHHRSMGHTIVIASAAVDLIAEPIARHLSVDHVVCTHMAWDGERLKDGFASNNCYGEAKRDAVCAYLQANGLKDRRTVFYTDSKSDFPLLCTMDATVVVDPKRKTEREAKAHGLPIQYWGQDALGFAPLEDVA